MLQELQRGDPRSIGPYQLVGQLGSGGMGRVFLGRSAGGRPVAVKVIRGDLAADPDFRMRFRREVAAARRVSGLFTAMVVDADLDAEEPWLATAYVPGPSLQETIHDHGRLPVTSVLALAAALAESLAAIHAAGVVHRDLKPSNVLLAEDGPRVIDFGISRAAESTAVTRAGFVLGSPGFMSPEQAEGGEVGPPSDIFSLGAVLAFAATGEGPWGSGSTAALIYRIVYAAPNLESVPDEIRPLVERCLTKDPRQRPSAEELLAEVGAMHPTSGWLPEPVVSALTGRQPQVFMTPPLPTPPPPTPPLTPLPTPPPLAAESGVPSAVPPDASPTLTGYTPSTAAKPGTAPPEPVIVPPEAGTAPRQPETRPTRLGGPPTPPPGPPPEPPTGPERGPVAPPPWGDLQGPRRSRSRRPVVVGAVAAAVILIASGATALALSGGHHPSPKPSTIALSTPTIITSVGQSPTTQSPTTQPSPTAAPTSHHASASPSRHPTPQHTTQPAVVPTTHAPTPVPATSSAAPRPRPTTPKPTHAPPPPTSYGFSVSGASEASCADLNMLQSSAGASVNFNFVNNSSGTVVIDEVGSSGGLISDATLSPGQQFPDSTYVGVYFVVEKSGGGCLGVFHITGSGHVTVT